MPTTSSYANQSHQHLYELGRQARDQGNTAKAEELWTQAIRVGGSSSQYHASLASSMTKRGALEEALPHWRKAQSMDPSRPALAANLGTVLLETNRLQEALMYFLEASVLVPESHVYRTNIASARAKLAQAQQSSAYTPVPPRPTSHYSDMQNNLHQRTEQMKRQPRYVYDDPNLTANAGRQWGANVAHGIAREQAMGNTEGEHRRIQFSAMGDAAKPSFPLIMERRGVPEERFLADVDFFWSTANKAGNQDVALMATMLCTLGIPWLALSLAGKSPNQVYQKGCVNRIREMNQYYRQFGIRWSYEMIPYTGPFLTYET